MNKTNCHVPTNSSITNVKKKNDYLHLGLLISKSSNESYIMYSQMEWKHPSNTTINTRDKQIASIITKISNTFRIHPYVNQAGRTMSQDQLKPNPSFTYFHKITDLAGHYECIGLGRSGRAFSHSSQASWEPSYEARVIWTFGASQRAERIGYCFYGQL